MKKVKPNTALDPFTPRELDLFMILDGQGEVAIDRIYKKYRPRNDQLKKSYMKQQELSWAIQRLSRKLQTQDRKIVPGTARQTYCIIDL